MHLFNSCLLSVISLLCERITSNHFQLQYSIAVVYYKGDTSEDSNNISGVGDRTTPAKMSPFKSSPFRTPMIRRGTISPVVRQTSSTVTAVSDSKQDITSTSASVLSVSNLPKTEQPVPSADSLSLSAKANLFDDIKGQEGDGEGLGSTVLIDTDVVSSDTEVKLSAAVKSVVSSISGGEWLQIFYKLGLTHQKWFSNQNVG